MRGRGGGGARARVEEKSGRDGGAFGQPCVRLDAVHTHSHVRELCSPPDACLLASVITLLYPDRPAICPYRKTKSREGVARSRLPPSRPTVLPPNCNITRSCPVFLPSTGRGSGEGVRGMWRRQRGARAAPRRQAPAARIGAAPEAIQCECQVVRDFHWGVVAAVFPVAVCGEPPGKRAAAVLHAPHAASPCCLAAAEAELASLLAFLPASLPFLTHVAPTCRPSTIPFRHATD